MKKGGEKVCKMIDTKGIECYNQYVNLCLMAQVRIPATMQFVNEVLAKIIEYKRKGTNVWQP